MSFSNDIAKFEKDLKIGLKNLEDKSAADGEEIVKSYTPVRTGRLQKAWKIVDSMNGPIISNDVPYGIYVNNGTEKFQGRFMIEKTIWRLKKNIITGKYNG